MRPMFASMEVRGRQDLPAWALPMRIVRVLSILVLLSVWACEPSGGPPSDPLDAATPSRDAASPGGTTSWGAADGYGPGDRVIYRGRTWTATASVVAGHAPLGVGDGSNADQRLLLFRREGFGGDVTGGYVPRSDAEVVHVTTAADSGPGSLREALAGDEPRWIVFDGDYHIVLVTGLDVGSNKTIDGRAHDILLQAPDDGDEDNWGLQVYGESNVIVHNIRIDGCGDWTRQELDDPYDCIDLQASNGVWIDHVSLSQAVDKLIGISTGTRNVTVSWSRFSENVEETDDAEFQQQVFQIGSLYAGRRVERTSTVTSHHNFFDDTGYRHPVISYGKAHAYNNYVYSFSLFGMRSERTAQLFVEANIFENTDTAMKDALKFDVGDDGCNDAGTLCDDRNGFVEAVGNVTINARIVSNRPARVFDPSSYYDYDPDRPGAALRRLLVGFSGWQPVLWEPVPA